jgi:hypothetical protein
LKRFLKFRLEDRLWFCEAVHDAFGPREVFLLALEIPMSRWADKDRSQVGYLVCQLDGLCPSGLLRPILDLKPLALLLGQRLVIALRLFRAC